MTENATSNKKTTKTVFIYGSTWEGNLHHLIQKIIQSLLEKNVTIAINDSYSGFENKIVSHLKNMKPSYKNVNIYSTSAIPYIKLEPTWQLQVVKVSPLADNYERVLEKDQSMMQSADFGLAIYIPKNMEQKHSDCRVIKNTRDLLKNNKQVKFFYIQKGSMAVENLVHIDELSCLLEDLKKDNDKNKTNIKNMIVEKTNEVTKVNHPSNLSKIKNTANLKNLNNVTKISLSNNIEQPLKNNLAIQINPSQSKDMRLTWIAERIIDNNKISAYQGIIFCLTAKDCEIVADYLAKRNILVCAFHSHLDDYKAKHNLSLFQSGQCQVIVTTKKLTNWYKLPPVRFVIHYQMPESLKTYESQITLASHSVTNTYAFLLHGEEDLNIIEYFMRDSHEITVDDRNDVIELLTTKDCLLKTINNKLNYSDNKPNCGVCSNCIEQNIIPIEVTPTALNTTMALANKKHSIIKPRNTWADGSIILPRYRYSNGLCLFDDYYSNMGQKVKSDKYINNKFSPELISLSSQFLLPYIQQIGINMIVPVPSSRRPDLVPEFSWHLANSLQIPYNYVVIKTNIGLKQKELNDTIKLQSNIEQTIVIKDAWKIKGKRILLVDDMVDSRWSFTVIAAKLLEAGASAVYPYALVKTTNGE